MKFHVTMLRTAETLAYVMKTFIDRRQVKILRMRQHHRKGSAYMVVTFEGPETILSAHCIGEITRITGVERLVKDDYETPEPPDFKQCQGMINVTPFSASPLMGRCRKAPVWVGRNKAIDKKKRVTLCQGCKENTELMLPATTFQKI
jgi:hypothetical protein